MGNLKLINKGVQMGSKDRIKQLKYNTFSQIAYTLTTLASGLILPRLIIAFFGSNVNGLLNSINQFLQVFSFLEMGMASVTISALFYPVAIKDRENVDKIVSSANNFYRRLGYVLLLYVLVMTVGYPMLVRGDFSNSYTSVLIVAYSASLFSQYFFGIVDRCILEANQRVYIYFGVQSISVVLNTVVSIWLIYIGCSIHVVKLVTAVIYIIRPIVIRLYINRNFDINRKTKYEGEPIRQKWNGVAQHISYIIINSTDTVILTLFSTLSTVSVYSVYNMVVAAINQLISAMFSSSSATLGNMYANEESGNMLVFFNKLETAIHAVTTIVFSCTIVLIVPFVLVYTKGVTDVEYKRTVFSLVFTLANYFWCLRIPYVLVITACGKYKETEQYFIKAAIMNVAISIVLVNFAGLIGVSIGTLVSMAYQFFALSRYVSNEVFGEKVTNRIKQLILDFIVLTIVFFAGKLFGMADNTYRDWIIYAVGILLISLGTSFTVYALFNRAFLKESIGKSKEVKIRKRRG